MATVTSLTADRMLAIEAASVVDGDVVGDNLILTKHDGTTIDAGNVRGPAGPVGPIGSDLAVIAAQQIYDVGIAGQIRAGRQLAVTDFTNIGLNAPIGLWNLSNLNDSSGNGRNLLNKGAVVFDSGINGLATTAAKFTGANTQALYIADTGAADPFRIKQGSWGCWFRSARRGGVQVMLSKFSGTNQHMFNLYTTGSNILQAGLSADGANELALAGYSDICDDRWHFCVVTCDNAFMRLYIDGILEDNRQFNGFLFPSSGPLNVGGQAADAAAVNAFPCFGRVDEAFITSDVLTEDQVRYLYCAKIPHTLGQVPTRTSLNVRRRRRGSLLTLADFAVQPLRLYNFQGGSLGDEGSNGQVLVPVGTPPAVVAGADGSKDNGYSFNGTTANTLTSTDAGLPSALATRSYGVWFKTNSGSGTSMAVLSWGNGATSDAGVWAGMLNGNLRVYTLGSAAAGPYVGDGQWHHLVVVEDNGAYDGVKQKIYLDGRLVANQTILNAVTLGGANRFRIGGSADGNTPFIGQIDSAFVLNYALTTEDVIKLFNKGSQALPPSPKAVGDNIEGFTATDILAIFDDLEGSYQVDLGVA